MDNNRIRFSFQLDMAYTSTLEEGTIEKENKINDIINQLGVTSKRAKRRADVWNLIKFIIEFYPSAQIIEAKDSPDIVIKLDNKYIGIEHTRIFKQDILKYAKSTQSILNKASTVYTKRFGEENPIYANIGFKNTYIHLKNLGLKENELMDIIADYVHQIRGKLNGNYHSLRDIYNSIESLYYKEKYKLYPENVIFSDACFITPSTTTNRFCLFSFIESSILSRKRLQQELDKKEINVSKYQNYIIQDSNIKLDEVWILLVISDNSTETFYEIREDILKNVHSSFNKVFILNDFTREIHAIK